MIHKSALICLFCAVATALPAADWPQWHGPNRDNVCTETGLLAAWPAGGPPLVWKTTGLGEGYSSVAATGGRIFTCGEFSNTALVVALELKTGKKLWQARLGNAGGGAGYPGPRATPTVDGNLVYALGQYGDLVCLKVGDGAEVWRKNLTNDFGGKMMSGWGYSESPLVLGDKLLCTPGGTAGTVVALNKKTGAVLWRSEGLTDPAAYSSLVTVKIAGVVQVIVFTGAHVAGLAPETGKLLWSAPRDGGTRAVAPTPVWKDDCVFVTSGYGVGCNLFQITRSNGEFKATEVYANQEMVNHHGGVVLVGQQVYGYGDKKGWVCLDFKTGNSLWASQKLGKGTLLAADGHLYLRGEAGTLVLIAATPTGWQETGRFDQPDHSSKTWAHLVISQGKLFVRDQDALFCYNLKP